MYKSKIDSFSLENINSDLLASILAAHTTSIGRSAYVVSLNELFQQKVDTDEECAVIPMLGKSASDIDYEYPHLSFECFLRPGGGCFDGLMLARKVVALSGYAVYKTGAENYGRLFVFWIFDDKLNLSEYHFSKEINDQLWLASEEESDEDLRWMNHVENVEFVEHRELNSAVSP